MTYGGIIEIDKRGNSKVNKVHVMQIIVVIVQVFAFIPLTAEVLGDMDPDIISASAIVIGICTIGNMVCAMIRVAQELKKR